MKNEITKVPHSDVVVYYESWQMNCCGNPFRVGDSINLTVEERHYQINYEKLDALPKESTYQYEGHGSFSGIPQFEPHGEVKKIFVEYCTFRSIKNMRYANPSFWIESEQAHSFMQDIDKAEYQGFLLVISNPVITVSYD